MAKQTFTTGQVLTAAQMTSLQQTAMGGGSATAKTASYVLVAADAGTVVAMNAAGSTTITVNTGLFSAGDTVFIQNWGAGTCTVTAGTATVSTHGSLALGQYEGGTLYFTSASAAIFFDISQTNTAPANETATVVTSESTTSTSFTDLTTAGPAVTLTTGTKALVIVGTQVYQNTADRGGYMGFAVSGATTIAASEAQAVGIFNGTATPAPKMSAAFVVTLTAGSNTFTAKYKRSGASGTAVFNDRNIFVMNLA